MSENRIFIGNVRGVQGFNVELRQSPTHIQWKLNDAGVSTWADLTSLEDIRGPRGFQVEFQESETHIQWKYEDEDVTAWRDLISFETIRGPRGFKPALQQTITHIQWKTSDPIDDWENLVALEDIRGPMGTGIVILGSFDTEEEFRTAHTGGAPGDAYIVGDNLFVWADNAIDWVNVGRIVGPQGIQGEQGPQGFGLKILDVFESEIDFLTAHSTGDSGDAYLVLNTYEIETDEGIEEISVYELYIWSETQNDWVNVGAMSGDASSPTDRRILNILNEIIGEKIDIDYFLKQLNGVWE